MRIRTIALVSVLALVGVACNGDDPELSTASTIVTGATNTTTPPSDGSTPTTADGDQGASPTTLVGENVTTHEVVNEVENDDGIERHLVIPDGAYTDVDLENFVIDLLEEYPDLHNAEIFNDAAAAEAFQVPEGDRTEEQTELLEEHHFVTLTGRARIDFRGPFAEFPGGAIGS